MKIALITDTHWGVRADNISFVNNNKMFLDNIFFPYLEKNNIDTLIHLGDLVDRRKYINFVTAKRLREDFLQPLAEKNIDVHLIVGNHDCYYKNTNEVNALRELVDGRYGFKIYDSTPEVVQFDGTDILFIPWISEEIKNKSLEVINESRAQIAMGHLEISGFEMYRGSIVSHGEDRNIFSKFDIVFSGHYHHRSTDGSIYYLGNHAEFTWSDYDDVRGFHVIDTDTRELTFISNPYTMFVKVMYDDTSEEFLEREFSFSEYNNKIVKIVVVNKTNLYGFERFVESIESFDPIDIQIVEDYALVNEEEGSIDEAESTLDIIRKYVDNVDTKNVNKNSLNKKIIELYNEALTIE